MKTIVTKNISLIFETSETGEPIQISEQLIDLLNATLQALNLPEQPQILFLAEEAECRVTDWEAENIL